MNSTSNWKALLCFEALLVIVLAVEIGVLSRTASNFTTTGNIFEVLRLSVEIGLLALVMTPVILTGGIDLSVGSLLGLCAILFGKLWRDAGLPPMVAAVITLALGALAGGVNALLITRLKLPPLIVTLGSFSLFRGLAEAITRGVDNFTGFPKSFLFFGQRNVQGGRHGISMPYCLILSTSAKWRKMDCWIAGWLKAAGGEGF